MPRESHYPQKAHRRRVHWNIASVQEPTSSTDRMYSEDEVLALARRAYRTGQAAFPVVPNRCALLVIDMQDEFVKATLDASLGSGGDADGATPRCVHCTMPRRRLANHLHSIRRDASWSRSTENGPSMPNRYSTPDISETWFREGQMARELAPGLRRPHYLQAILWCVLRHAAPNRYMHNLDRDTIVITGALTNFCCGMTARQGYERGFNVVFVSDLTATDDTELPEVELAVMRKGFARVMSAGGISRQC